MITLSKTLQISDYEHMRGHLELPELEQRLSRAGVAHRYEHPNRRWEYGLAWSAIVKNSTKSVLDVGGGGSIFAPYVAIHGLYVLQVDPGDVGKWIEHQSRILGYPMDFVQQDFMTWEDDRKFDAVTCLSVIEHVPNDLEFFERLLDKVKDGGLLCLTTDFHPSGKALVGGHLRTYNKKSMQIFIDLAASKRFSPHLGEPNYEEFEVNVHSYTFASLILRKE